jgi:alpha-tubulin suppressor-like RCC1 family protein
MNRLALRAWPARPVSARRRRLTPWAAGTVLAAAGALTAVPLPAGAATAGPLPITFFSGAAIAGWGNNDLGQLGTGMASKGLVLSPMLTALPPGTRITQVAPGCDQALALTSTGSVLAWGDNSQGELGNGSAGGFSATPAPVRLPAGVRIREVSAGCDFSLAVSTDGQVWGWGDDVNGQLGTKAGGFRPSPVQAQLPPGVRVRTVSAGGAHSLAVTTTGRALAWGDNENGQLGTGSTSTGNATPVPVHLPPGTRVASVSAGDLSSEAVTVTGEVLGWGAQAGGVLGNGASSGRAVTPVRALIRPGVRVRSIFTGCFHTLAVTTTGTVLAWGDNSDGELGTGTTQPQSSPLPVLVQLPLGTRAVAVGGGCRHSAALTSRGQILAWGRAGLLGNGSTALSAAPVQVQLPGSSAIGTGGSAAGDFSLALLPRVPPA